MVCKRTTYILLLALSCSDPTRVLSTIQKQLCIKEIEGFKVSKMHWVLYSSENPDTFSFHILTCWVDLSTPLKELQGDGLSFAPRDMSWHVPCFHLFQIHLEEQWNWLVWKCLGDPPSFFLRKGSVECLNILYPLVIQQLFINHGLSCFQFCFISSDISGLWYFRHIFLQLPPKNGWGCLPMCGW